MTAHVANLLQIKALVEQHAPELSRWFSGGVNGYMVGRGLEWSLGIDGDARYEYLLAARNTHLGAACRLLPGKTPWARATELRDELRRFESIVWARVKFDAEPPDRLNDLQSCLFLAFKTGIQPPGSVRQLRDICEIYSAGDFTNGGPG